MKILKLSYEGAPLNWQASDYVNPEHPLLQRWEIVTNKEIPYADAWFTLENLKKDKEECSVPNGMTFFGNLETCFDLDWALEKEPNYLFYDQFDSIRSCYLYNPEKSISTPPFLPWMLFANHGKSVWQQPTYPQIRDLRPTSKTKKISIICSSQRLTPGHRARIHFTKFIKKHFGQSVVWYGNGINSVKEKYEALAPYQYSLVLENQSRYNVITEKLGDAFLAYSYPFYWGAPNASSYFNDSGFSQIDIEDFHGAKLIIEQALDENWYEDRFNQILVNRNRVLDEFNFISRMLYIVEEKSRTNMPDIHKRTIRNSKHYYAGKRDTIFSMRDLLMTLLLSLDKKAGTNFQALLRELNILLKHNLISAKFRSMFKKLTEF